MPIIYVDNVPYEISEGQNLLRACLSLGFDVPYFCWHPALHSVGACRQCAVKQFRDEKDTKGFIVMSCVTEAQDGMRISIDDPEVKEFRAAVIEWMMQNHPHDCPVCDEGGECHLQDMTVMTGHTYRRYRFKKRTYRNQNLGPFINHEMNRCIQCYRCVRFYRDYAGGRDFNVFGIHSRVYFGRHKDGVLENEFSGNLIEICPTGVFTDKTLKKHYTRKWDLQTAPSICVHCGLGCNTIPGERYGSLRRIYNRYNQEVNGYFICDRGRFAYEFVNSEQRPRTPMIRKNGDLRECDKEEALSRICEILDRTSNVMGIGSPRASLESNFALRYLVGPENFYVGLSGVEHSLINTILQIMRGIGVPSASLHDVECSDAVFVLGEDVTNYVPRLALSLRQSIRQKHFEIAEKMGIPLWNDLSVRLVAQAAKSPVYVASFQPTKIDDITAGVFYGAPQDVALLGFAVASEIDSNAPKVCDLSDTQRAFAKQIADTLRAAHRPLIVVGTGSGSTAIVHAGSNIALALHKAGGSPKMAFTVPECNSIGLGLMAPRGLDAAFQKAFETKPAALIILENNLYRRADREIVTKFLQSVGSVIVLDHLLTQTSAVAEVILPVGTFAESDGTLVNNEGRSQRFFQVMPNVGEIKESWRWIQEIIVSAGRLEQQPWNSLDEIIESLVKEFPILDPIQEIAPGADFRIFGMKVPRQPHRYSGRTAMNANITVHEPKPPEDPDSSLSFSMEGYHGKPPSALIPRFWAPKWNSIQALNKFQSEVGGSLVGGDPGRRLIEPTDQTTTYFDDLPEPFQPRDSEWLFVPVYHIFGTEELSALAPAISERLPEPYVGIGQVDAELLGLQEEENVRIMLNGSEYTVRAKIVHGLVKGIATLPVGLAGLEGIDLPTWGKISRD